MTRAGLAGNPLTSAEYWSVGMPRAVAMISAGSLANACGDVRYDTYIKVRQSWAQTAAANVVDDSPELK